MDRSIEALVPIGDLIEDLQRHLGSQYPPQVELLAEGEYSLSYLVRYDEQEVVARCVTGSQLGLSPADQVAREAHALELVAASGRAPRLISVQTAPKKVVYPFMVRERLPGRLLDYATDLELAARCIAAVHEVRIPEDHKLVVHDDPALPLLDEAWLLAQPYLSWDAAPPASISGLKRLFEVAESSLENESDPFREADLSIVNANLDSHNFVVQDDTASLLNWDRARIAPSVQDLAHFLAPTTTLGHADSAVRLSDAGEDLFLSVYLEERPHIERDRLLHHLQVMKLLTSLRAVGRCAWLAHATATGSRPQVGGEMLAVNQALLEPDFLEELASIRP